MAEPKLCQGVTCDAVDTPAVVNVRWKVRSRSAGRLQVHQAGQLMCMVCLGVRLSRAALPADDPNYLFGDLGELTIRPVR